MAPGKLIATAFVRDRIAETALAGFGVSAAVVSVGFAGYMIVVGPRSGPGDHHRAVTAEQLPVRTFRAAEASDASDGGLSVDFTPTGSIPGQREASTLRQSEPPPGSPLADFVVRDVFDGTALIEARGMLQMVKPGDMLEGVGRVLAIERKARGWLVRTAGGTIGQRR